MTGHISASGSALPSPDPDADLIFALAQGTSEQKSLAFGELMERHLASVKSLAWHMLRDEMKAEDIAQEVFLRVWKTAEKWEPGRAKFSTWMHRVAKNLCYDALRKKTEIYSDSVPEMHDTSTLAPHMIMQDEGAKARKDIIIAALSKIPESQAMAINLCHYQNKSQKEAAEIMEMGVRAYESLLARGRRNLRNLLSAHRPELLDGLED